MQWLKRIPSRVDRVIVVVVASTGLVLPWVVAFGVKLYLQAQGRPTVHWSDIAAYAIYFGPVGSVIAAAPLIGLAILYRRWTLGMLLPWPPLMRRLVVLCTFAGGVVGMVRVFTDIFWDFDALLLWFIPVAVVMYLPWMAGGFVVGALLAKFAGFVVTKRRASPSAHDDAGGVDRRPPGAGDAKSQGQSEGRTFGAELRQEAAARARSLRTAAAAAGVEFVATVSSFTRASKEGNLLQQFLLGLAMVCFVWASWAVLRGAWLLGRDWMVGFFVCAILAPPLLVVFGLVVFLRLRRISSDDHRGMPTGDPGPARGAGILATGGRGR